MLPKLAGVLFVYELKNAKLGKGQNKIVLEAEESMFHKERWICSALVKEYFYKLTQGLCLIIHLTVYQPWKWIQAI